MSIYQRKFKNARTGEVWRLDWIEHAWFGFVAECSEERTTLYIDELIQAVQDGEIVMLPEDRAAQNERAR